jgi:hypothetical protein
MDEEKDLKIKYIITTTLLENFNNGEMFVEVSKIKENIRKSGLSCRILRKLKQLGFSYSQHVPKYFKTVKYVVNLLSLSNYKTLRKHVEEVNQKFNEKLTFDIKTPLIDFLSKLQILDKEQLLKLNSLINEYNVTTNEFINTYYEILEKESNFKFTSHSYKKILRILYITIYKKTSGLAPSRKDLVDWYGWTLKDTKFVKKFTYNPKIDVTRENILENLLSLVKGKYNLNEDTIQQIKTKILEYNKFFPSVTLKVKLGYILSYELFIDELKNVARLLNTTDVSIRLFRNKVSQKFAIPKLNLKSKGKQKLKESFRHPNNNLNIPLY